MAHPQIKSVTCWLLECVGCSNWSDRLDDFQPHFTSADEAERDAIELFDFSRDDDGVLRCPECTKAAKCAAAVQHTWVPWQAAGGQAGGRFRWCEVCDAAERQLPTVVELPEVPF